MKGVMFTELVAMMELRYSPELADRVLMRSDLSTGGAYTAVASYPSAEWLRIIAALSQETGVPASELARDFGEYLFGAFEVSYPSLLSRFQDALTLLEAVNDFIHVEVLKLYPDAHFPTFRTRRDDPDVLIVDYASPRPLADLAEGLIYGALSYFGERAEVTREDTPGAPSFRTRFTVRRA